MRLKTRIEALEGAGPDEVKVWHQVIQEVGETREQAIAKHESEHGPVGDDEGVILMVIVEPKPREAIACPV